MACKEKGSLLFTTSQGFWFGTREGVKTFYIHPAFCRGTKHNPHQFTHCLLSSQTKNHPSQFYLQEKEALKFCSNSTSGPGTKWWGLPWLPAAGSPLLQEHPHPPHSAPALSPTQGQWWHRESSCASQHQPWSQQGCRRRMLRSLDFCFCGFAIVWGLNENYYIWMGFFYTCSFRFF